MARQSSSPPSQRHRWRRLASILVIVLMLSTLGVLDLRPQTPAHAASPLISQNKPASASSVENSELPASAAVDGNSGTRWSSAWSDPQWIRVDLGSIYTIDRVVLQWEAAYGQSYQIQVSDDGSSWTTIYSTTSGNGGSDDLSVAGSGRYVRMYGTQRATQYGYSLWEFEIYGTASSSCNGTLVSQSRPAISSSAEDSTLTAPNAVDGNSGTRWSSAWSDPQWIHVDLGSAHTIDRVVLSWEAAYGRSYQIQVSDDGSSWTTIYSTTSGDGGSDDLDVAGSGRYVRMYGTQRATQYGYSLWELQVYGCSDGSSDPGWSLVWSDEFNGSSIDPSNWTFEVGGHGWGNNEHQYYTDGDNAWVANGNLVIEARRENPAGYQCWYGTCEYTSSRMMTASKQEFTYGKIEARIRVPYGQGIWPAFWMLGNDIGSVGWPDCGEIDIMENIGSEPATVHGTIHGPGYSGSGGIGGSYTLSSGRLADDFHLYTVEWDADSIHWYIDGINYFNVDRATVESSGPWVFDHPFFIILNVAVGGNWPGYPDSTTTFPQRMYLDYVRVYQ